MDVSAASEPARAAEAPAPTSAAEAPEPPCAADAPTPPSVAAAPSFGSAALVGSGAATSLQSSSSGSSTAKASTKTAAPTQKEAKGKGRPPKAKGTEALEWSEAMTASLMRLRFATFCAKFQSARNNAMIRAAWLLLAGEISKEYEVIISSEQCKNKIKGLKKKWAEYCSDISSTGNNVDKPIVEPVCLELMEEYWTSGTGMQGESLADNDNVGSLFDSDSEDDNGNTGGRKRGKTVAEGLEVGMKA
ncbi:hypothetical protein PF010_g27015, partial [Phytophthora fragariae]